MSTEETPAIYFYILGNHRIIYFTGRRYDNYYYTVRKHPPYMRGGTNVPAIENISKKTYSAVVGKGRMYLYINDGEKWVAYRRGIRRKLSEAELKQMEEDYQARLRGEKTKTYSWREVQAHLKVSNKVLKKKIRMEQKVYKLQQRLWKNRPFTLTKKNFSRLKRLHTQAVKMGADVFEFEDKKIVTDYVKILIENLGHQFKKR